jgi:hypothetical protein
MRETRTSGSVGGPVGQPAGSTRLFGGRAPLHAKWTENTTTQVEEEVAILNNLWVALPRPPFTDEETQAAAKRVYDYVWQQNSSGHELAAGA